MRVDNYIALPNGTPIDKYTIQFLLGSGGFGITYLGHDDSLGRQVAIKECLPIEIAVSAPDSFNPRRHH